MLKQSKNEPNYIEALPMRKLFIICSFLSIFVTLPIAKAVDQSPMIKIDETEANSICNHFNMFVWWSCREHIKGLSIQADVRDWVLKLRDNTEMDAQILRATFMNANGKKFDSAAMDFLSRHGLIVPASVPRLFSIMGDKEYDEELLGNCNSRSTVANITQPILSARRLNQPTILNCITLMSDVKKTLAVQGTLLKCSARVDLVSFNVCIEPGMNAAREKQKADKK